MLRISFTGALSPCLFVDFYNSIYHTIVAFHGLILRSHPFGYIINRHHRICKSAQQYTAIVLTSQYECNKQWFNGESLFEQWYMVDPPKWSYCLEYINHSIIWFAHNTDTHQKGVFYVQHKYFFLRRCRLSWFAGDELPNSKSGSWYYQPCMSDKVRDYCPNSKQPDESIID